MVGQRALTLSGDHGLAIFRIQKNQINIRRDIQFASTQLAHAHHDHVLSSARFLAHGSAVQLALAEIQVGQMAVDHEVRKRRYGAQDLIQIAPASQITLGDGRNQQVSQATHGCRQ